MVVYKRWNVFLISLDPTKGFEIQKTRPCVIISPNEINQHLKTVIVAPMTSSIHSYPFRINLRFNNRNAQIILDQVRTVDKLRLIKHIGVINSLKAQEISNVLVEMFTF